MSSAPEYRLLGLRPREARLEVIRSALTATASSLREDNELEYREDVAWGNTDSDKKLVEERLAEVTLAGYRLLDPRRRRNLLERVQLLLWSDEELERPATSLWDEASELVSEQLVSEHLAAELRNATGEQRPISIHAAVTCPRSSVMRVTARPVFRIDPQAEEAQVALDVFRMLRQRDRHATAIRLAAVALGLSILCVVALVSAFLLT